MNYKAESQGNSPAYPGVEPTTPNSLCGLSKREYFAAMALQGLLFCSDLWGKSIVDTSRVAVEFADALLQELHPTKQLKSQDEPDHDNEDKEYEANQLWAAQPTPYDP